MAESKEQESKKKLGLQKIKTQTLIQWKQLSQIFQDVFTNMIVAYYIVKPSL